MPLAAGVRLGPYEIVSALGAGGMGEVYKARDTRLERTVAIKVLPAHVASDPDLRQRFDREARAVAALNHPHICTLHDIGSQDGVDFLVMEYLDGETLAERLASGSGLQAPGKALPLEQALTIAIQIASALDKAHRAGITHRDLKPGNIMLTKAGAKLLDFGLAKASAQAAAGTSLSMLPTTPQNLTAQGTILGTFQYMAPEQLEGQAADARTDIFAFGAVLHEMLTGKKAFEGKGQASLIGAIMNSEPPTLSTLQPMAPAALDRVVATCLAKDPDQRWQTAADLQRQLKWILEAGSQAGAAAPLIPVRKRRDRLVVAGISAAVAGLVAGVAAWMLKPEPQRRIARFAVTLPEGEQFSATSRHIVAISPDGARIVYVANNRLNVRAMDQIEVTAVRGSEEGNQNNFGRSPFFSPDGQWIGFWQQGQLRRISVNGGAAVKLCDVGIPFGASWGSDDTILYGQGAQGIWRVSGRGGTPEKLIEVDASKEEAHGPQMLPGGDKVVFTLLETRPSGSGPSQSWDDAQIVVQSLASGERKVLIDGGRDGRYVPTGHLVYAREGTLFAVPFDLDRFEVTGGPVPVVEGIADAGGDTGAAHFSISADGTLVYTQDTTDLRAKRTLVWVERSGKEQPVVLEPRAYEQPRISPDGTRVAMFLTEQEGGIWIWDTARGTLNRLTTGPGRSDYYPVWTRDGLRIVFASSSPDGQYLWWRAADGTDMPERLTTETAVVPSPTDVSPDGMHLVFYHIPMGGTRDVMQLTLDGTRQVSPLVQTSSEEASGVVSPNGRWLAYQSNRSGRFEISVRPFPNTTTGQWPVSTSGGLQPMWARSGKELFFVGADNTLMSVTVDTNAATWPATTPARLFDVSPYYPSATARRQYDVAGDGRFLMIKPGSTSEAQPPSLIVVQNWLEELKRVVPTK